MMKNTCGTFVSDMVSIQSSHHFEPVAADSLACNSVEVDNLVAHNLVAVAHNALVDKSAVAELVAHILAVQQHHV